MRTRFRRQRPRNESTDERSLASIQPRPFSDPYDNQRSLQNHDLSHVDLFSHTPQRGAIQAKLTSERSQNLSGPEFEQATPKTTPELADHSIRTQPQNVIQRVNVRGMTSAIEEEQRRRKAQTFRNPTRKTLETFFAREIQSRQTNPQKIAPDDERLQILDQKLGGSLPTRSRVDHEEPALAPETEITDSSETTSAMDPPLYPLVKELEADYADELTNQPTHIAATGQFAGTYVNSQATDKLVRQLTPEELAAYELTSKKISDLSPTTQEQYAAKIAKEQGEIDNPIFFWKGIPYSTSHMTALKSGLGGRSIFVMTTDGKIYSADQEAESAVEAQVSDGSTMNLGFHHSSFLAGKPVAAAGELIFDGNGHLRGVTNSSGHYKPEVKHLRQVLQEFQKRGVDLSNIDVAIYLKEGTCTTKATILLEFTGESNQEFITWLTQHKVGSFSGNDTLQNLVKSINLFDPMKYDQYSESEDFSQVIEDAGLTVNMVRQQAETKVVFSAYQGQGSKVSYTRSDATKIAARVAEALGISLHNAFEQLFSPPTSEQYS